MYIGVLFILSGWVITTGSPFIFGFTVALFTAFYFRVKMHEEPWAEQMFGAEWLNYKNNVPSWLPQTKGYCPNES